MADSKGLKNATKELFDNAKNNLVNLWSELLSFVVFPYIIIIYNYLSTFRRNN